MNPEDLDQYTVYPTKHQYASAREARAFTYEWETVSDRGIVKWGEMSDLSDDELNESKVDKKEHRTKKKECEDWLKEFMSTGPRTSTDVYTQGEARGFHHKMIDRASRELGIIKSTRQPRPEGGRGTVTTWATVL